MPGEGGERNPYAPPAVETSPRVADGEGRPGEIRYVVFRYAISMLFFTYSSTSQVIAVGRGHHAWIRGLPYTLCSLLLGWWGFPWGPIKTIQALATNLSGGEDVTYATNKAIHGVEDPRATWTCPRCKSSNPNTSFGCVCGYRLV